MVALIRLQGMLVLGLLDHVARTRERGNHFAAIGARVPAAVVKMEVRVHDHIDVFRFYAAIAKPLDKMGAFESIDIPKLDVLFFADSGLYQDALSTGQNEEAIKFQANAIASIRLNFLLPQWLRNYAEHRSTV